MPRGDGTGPDGRGRMTGRRAGYCAGYGAGFGGGRGPGRGFGRGFGRGDGFGAGRVTPPQPLQTTTTKEDLQQRLADLEAEAQALRKQLTDSNK